MKRNPNFLLKKIADTTYLLPYGQGISDFFRGIQINETGEFVWNSLTEEHTEEEILSMCAKYYEIEEDDLPQLSKDIHDFLHTLETLGILWNVSEAISKHTDTVSLRIAGLILQLNGDPNLISQHFSDFIIPETNVSPDMVVQFTSELAPAPVFGTLLIDHPQLQIYDCDLSFQLLFPQNKHVKCLRLSKDASNAVFYYLNTMGDTLKEELFLGIREAFLYLAQLHHMVALHSASILYKDRAWLFSGHSGMGKTTHTTLWAKQYHTPVINGDLNLLALEDNHPVVHGTPWCGTSGIYQTTTYPLGGIVLLQRSSTDYTEELTPDKRILLVNQRLTSPSWSEELFDINLDITKKIVPEILVCKLYCTKNPRAAEVMKERIDCFL